MPPARPAISAAIAVHPIMSRQDTDPQHLRIRLGTVESDIEERPMAHIFVTSKANWDQISGDLPQYEEQEPGR